MLNFRGEMRRCMVLCVSLLSLWTLCDAQNNGFPPMSFPRAPQQQPRDSTGWRVLRSGDATMTIDTAFGARIVSLKHGGTEAISQLRWPESFGSTFWTSPQSEWNWPPVQEFDKAPYEITAQSDSSLALRGKVAERFGLRVEKRFVAKGNEKFLITYSIVNEGKEARRVAPWEITRVLNGGTVFFDAPTETLWTAGPNGERLASALTYEESDGAQWYESDEAQANRKMNADAKGWLAWYDGKLLLVRHFTDLSDGQPAPGEAEVQVYVNRGKSYIELECQGAYVQLQPGERIDWCVEWQVANGEDAEKAPQGKRKWLMEKVKEMGN